MTIERFAGAVEWLGTVGPWLEEREAAHCLMLGQGRVLAGSERAANEADYFGLARDRAGAVAGAIFRQDGFNAVLSESELDGFAEGAAEAVFAALGQALPGVMAPAGAVAAFAGRWRELSGCAVSRGMDEGIHEVAELVRPRSVEGRYRTATLADAEWLTDWLEAFREDAGTGDPADREDLRAAVLRRVAADERTAGMRLWEVDGEPVSIAGYTGPTRRGNRLGPVYTPAASRGRGYASAVTAALTEELLAAGRERVFLFTDLDNPVSNHVYRKLGYREVARVRIDRFAY